MLEKTLLNTIIIFKGTCMEHYWSNVTGWFSEPDTHFYKAMVDRVSEKSHFVEVGCWKGRSSSFMAVEIINSGKDIQFDCVDTWMGDPNEVAHQNDPNVMNGTLFEEFLNNMKPVEGKFKPVRLDSVSAAATYADNSLDFVFIDAAHDYDSVKADIIAWLPKVKAGGVFSGHDFNHPPVKRAVNEMLPFATDGGAGQWVMIKE